MQQHNKNTIRMKIALAQFSVIQGNFDLNITKVEKFAKDAKKNNADIIVFPEMFVCGFNYRKNLAFVKDNQQNLLNKLSDIAKSNNIYLCGSIPFLLDENLPPANRMILFDNNGIIIANYDKIHLFSLFNENNHCCAGNKIEVIDTPLGKIAFAICYDLRFPELFTSMAKKGAQIVILSAAWPHPRSDHWDILTRARAIENQLFFIAVNQAGTENFVDKKIEYFGLSRVINPWGKIVAEGSIDKQDTIIYADINLDEIDSARTKIPAQKDRRSDIY